MPKLALEHQWKDGTPTRLVAFPAMTAHTMYRASMRCSAGPALTGRIGEATPIRPMATNRRIRSEVGREDQVRAEIVAAAKRLVQRHGLRKVTMDDIAAALGKKKSFLYYYYPGRREVIRAMIESELGEVQRYVRGVVSQKTTPAERLRTFVVARLETVLKQASAYGPAIIAAALQGAELGTDIASVVELRQSFDREEARFLAGLVRQGIQEGAFAPLSNKVIDDITYFLLSALRGVELELALSREPPPSFEPRMAKVLDIFFRGLAT